MEVMHPTVIRPQEGKQEQFLASSVDLAIYGGSAGSGKSVALLLEAARNIDVPGYYAIIFRRTTPQITNEGSLWDESQKLYRPMGGWSRETRLEWHFPAHSRIKFSHMEYEKTKYDHHGAQYVFIGFDEVCQFCLTPDHEVLTTDGWVPIADVKPGNKVMSMMPDKSAEFKEVTDTPSFDYDDEMVDVLQESGISFCATPNHRVLIQRQDADNSLGFVTAEHLEKTIQEIPRAASVNREDCTEDIELPWPTGRGCGSNINATRVFPIEDYLEFLGWYLSEGSAYIANASAGGSSPCVSIRQTRPNEQLALLMERMPFTVCSDGDNGYRIYSRQLFDHLKPLGNLYEKRVPRWVLQRCSTRQLFLFLDAFIEGDGHRRSGGGASIGLANSGLTDDLQEVCALCGLVATRGYSRMHDQYDVYRLSISRPERRVTMVQPRSCQRVGYTGKVHCLTVDGAPLKDFTRGGYQRDDVHGGNFLIRHRGRVSFTGNSRGQFWYMFSRLRSSCGIPCYIRATCNPDPDSFVADLVSWYIDPETGYPIPERSGVVRYFARLEDDQLAWGDTPDDILRAHPHLIEEENPVKSFTFIAASVDDNPILLQNNPAYKGNLQALSLVDRERLLKGNWHIRPAAGTIYRRDWFPIFDASGEGGRIVRYWDRAATEPSSSNPDPDWTVGCKARKAADGFYYVEDVCRFRGTPNAVKNRIHNVATQDGTEVEVLLAKDPGQAGKAEVNDLIRHLHGFTARAIPETKAKVVRAKPVSAQTEAGNVRILRAKWNKVFLDELESFGSDKGHDDQADAYSGAINALMAKREPRATWL